MSAIMICDQCRKKIKEFHTIALNKGICLDFCGECIKNPDIKKAKMNYDYFNEDKEILF